ncbi:MAG: hypothetical protein LAP85_14975 [Acidobacteriia bacterium]|nr:hypothetical protein [Terriglobia bacterium]
MGLATYKYLLDINGDGNLVDITQYVYRAQWRFGRDFSSQLTGRSSAGTCTLSVRNRTSYFSKYNPASPLHGKTLPGMLMRIQMSVNGGQFVIVWQGDLDSITPEPGDHINGATATIRGVGVLSRTSEVQVTIPMHEGITTGDAITHVLDAANFPAGDRLLDTGCSTLSRYWTQEKIAAFQALRDLEENECGFIRETKDGKICFEDRAHRAGHSVVASWDNRISTGNIRYSGISPQDCTRDVYNIIEATIHTFNISEEQVVWCYVDLAANNGGDPIALEPSETKKITAKFTPSGNNIAVNEWGMIDYQAYANADGSGAELTEHVDIVPPDKTGMTMDLEITNNNAVRAYVTLLRAHGTMVVESDGATVKAAAEAKIDRTYPFPGKYLTNVQEAQDFCDHLLAIYKEPRPIVTIVLRAHASETNLVEAQTRDVSDLIHVLADEKVGLYLDGEFFVESISHDVDVVAGTHLMTVECSEESLHEWPNSSYPYEPKVIPPPTTGPGSPHVPDDLWVNAISNGLGLDMGCAADKWNVDIDGAEFRAQLFGVGFSDKSVDLRTPAEGGALEHNGTDKWVVTGLKANMYGARFFIKAAQQGRLYFTFRLHNSKGWSVWSDGNDTPSVVTDFLDTEDEAVADDGPPADWAVEVIKGIAEGTCRVRASRPNKNSHKILFAFFQIKDSTTGAWRDVSADSGIEGSAKVLYDGSGVSHTLDPVTGELTIDEGGPADYGDGLAGGLLLMDVRAGQFNEKYCLWNGIGSSQISGNKIPDRFGIRLAADPDEDGKYHDVRLMIVKPPWEWTAEGYQGAQTGLGMYMGEYWRNGGDKATQTFESIDIPFDSAVDFNKLQGRVWFANAYSFSDDDTVSKCPTDPPPGGNDPGVIIIKTETHIVIDCNLGSIFYLLLTADAILDPLKNAKHCRPTILVVQQDAAGGHKLVLDEKYNTGIDIDDVSLSGESESRDYFGFMYNADYDEIDVVAFVRGY